MDDAGRRIQEIVDERNAYRSDLQLWKGKHVKSQHSLAKLQEKQKNLKVHLEKLQEHGDELEEDCGQLQDEMNKLKAELKRIEDRLNLKKVQAQNNEKQFDAQKKQLLKSADVAEELNTQLTESKIQIGSLLAQEAKLLKEFRHVTGIWDNEDTDSPLIELKHSVGMELESTTSAHLPCAEDRPYIAKRALVDLSATDSEDEDKPDEGTTSMTPVKDFRKNPAKRSAVSSPSVPMKSPAVVTPSMGGKMGGMAPKRPSVGGKTLPLKNVTSQFPSMRSTYTSPQEVAEDWFGLGSSSFAPLGGVLGLENAGAEWRAHFSRIESSNFIAMHRVAMCVAFYICQSKNVEWSKDEPFAVSFTHEEVLTGAKELEDWIKERLLPNPRHGYLRGIDSCLQVFSFHQ